MKEMYDEKTNVLKVSTYVEDHEADIVVDGL